MSDPFLVDRADGVRGHYCVARLKDDNATHEFYNDPKGDEWEGRGSWSASGSVYHDLKTASGKLLRVFAAALMKSLDHKKW